MLKRFSFAQYLIAGGLTLGLLGLVLWWALPIPTPYPPFLVTSLLAIVYGGYELRRKKDASKP